MNVTRVKPMSHAPTKADCSIWFTLSLPLVENSQRIGKSAEMSRRTVYVWKKLTLTFIVLIINQYHNTKKTKHLCSK